MASRNEPETYGIIMAAEFHGGVVFGADIRTRQGSYVLNYNAHKFIELSPSICLCGSGLSDEHMQQLARDIRTQLQDNDEQKQKPISENNNKKKQQRSVLVNKAAYACRNLINEQNLSVELLLGGWDLQHGGQVFAMGLGRFNHRPPFACKGPDAKQVFENMEPFYQKSFTRKECEDFVVKGMAIATGSESSAVRLGIITKDGLEQQIVSYCGT